MKCILFSIVVIMFYGSCKTRSRNQDESQEINERLTDMNAKIVAIESKEIEEFIKRHNYQMKETGTGLRYEITEHAKIGANPTYHDVVSIHYRLFLLSGNLCFNTAMAGPKKFRLGTMEEVKGLEEGVMLMVPGEKARLVVPAHLGYGISGDQNKIPPASALYYEVELLSIEK